MSNRPEVPERKWWIGQRGQRKSTNYQGRKMSKSANMAMCDKSMEGIKERAYPKGIYPNKWVGEGFLKKMGTSSWLIISRPRWY